MGSSEPPGCVPASVPRVPCAPGGCAAVTAGPRRGRSPEACAPRRPHHCLSASPCSADHSGRVVAEKPLRRSPPWEEAVVSKIRTMSVSERCLMLESILCCLQQHSQVGAELHPLPGVGGSLSTLCPGVGGSLSTLCPRVGGSLSTLCPGAFLSTLCLGWGAPSPPSALGGLLLHPLPWGGCSLYTLCPGRLPLPTLPQGLRAHSTCSSLDIPDTRGMFRGRFPEAGGSRDGHM